MANGTNRKFGRHKRAASNANQATLGCRAEETQQAPRYGTMDTPWGETANRGFKMTKGSLEDWKAKNEHWDKTEEPRRAALAQKLRILKARLAMENREEWVLVNLPKELMRLSKIAVHSDKTITILGPYDNEDVACFDAPSDKEWWVIRLTRP